MPSLRGRGISPRLFEGAGCPAWETVIKVREEDELFSLFVCADRERLKGFAFAMVEQDEIVVVNARGNFENVLSSLLRSTLHDEEALLAAGYSTTEIRGR